MDSPLIYIALIHYPVLNRKGEEIASAFTNLDIHDIARVAKTYGVRAYYIVHPIPEQISLAKELVAHWIDGIGGELNPSRKEALEVIRFASDLAQVKKEIHDETGESPLSFCTTAREREDSASWDDMKKLIKLEKKQPFLLLFGTASGLSEEIFTHADGTISPIEGKEGYNHISVRSAVSITLDRLLSN